MWAHGCFWAVIPAPLQNRRSSPNSWGRVSLCSSIPSRDCVFQQAPLQGFRNVWLAMESGLKDYRDRFAAVQTGFGKTVDQGSQLIEVRQQ